MKAEKRRTSLLRRALSPLTKNWGLKLLSLVIAIIIYHSLKQGSDFSHETNERYIFQNH